MSYRRSLSFAEGEEHLVKEFDKNGKSDFAKDAMKFFIRYKDKVILAAEGLNLVPKQEVPIETKAKALKLIKR